MHFIMYCDGENTLSTMLADDPARSSMDNKIIQRKRLDTLEMCRIFNAEKDRLNNQLRNQLKPRHFKNDKRKRVKRDLENDYNAQSLLKEEDAKRVEQIIDKLYDDLNENGHTVKYRQRVIAGHEEQNAFNQSARRYNFAPAQLLPPTDQKNSSYNSPPQPVHSSIHWVKTWKHGIVPYFVDPKTYDSQLAEIIMAAFDYVEKATCIRLQRLREKPRDKMSLQEVEWIYISNPTGIRQCVHSNERLPNKGVQMVVLGYDCMSQGEILHEVMHVLGFSHEHTRSDRDRFITINWDNIKPGYKKYFETREPDDLEALPYDYDSVLHYPPRAFSKNGKVTLAATKGVKLGQREGLSTTDVEKIVLVFGNECVERNKEYLLSTCPSVVKKPKKHPAATKDEIKEYFKDRIWPYAIVTYKLRDPMEFSTDERENIKAVIKHIEKETCIKFKDVTEEEEEEEIDKEDKLQQVNDIKEDNPFEETIDEQETVTEDAVEDAVEDEKEEETTDSSSPDNLLTENPSDGLADKEDKKDKNDVEYERDYVVNPVFKSAKGRSRNEISNEIVKDKKEEKKHMRNRKQINITSTPSKTNVSKVRRKRSVNATMTPIGLVPERRHSASILVLSRDPKPGCTCPPPGMGESNNVIKLSTDCFNSVNDLLHVFVHILGLEHQHNMHDRDDYLHILWDKLTPEVKKEMKEKLPPAASVGFPYDYQSVMHYPWLQIKDGVTHMMYPIWNDGWAMGHWQGLSYIDVQKLKLLYQDQCTERIKEENKEHTENKK